MALDLLAIGPHPDDVELGMGGTLAKLNQSGRTTLIADLTQGEMGSNGTPAIRVAEGARAAQILGCRGRVNLGLPDRSLDHRDPAQIRALVSLIRRERPVTVALNWGADRHPDHVAGCALVEEAIFMAGLRRYETGEEPYRPRRVWYYFINDEAVPSVYVDISSVWAVKRESLFAHVSQFGGAAGEVETRLNRPYGLPYLVESRDRLFGAKLGVAYAEGFITKQPIALDDLTAI
jgi:bacillithiol biosynthesis deacetylase BshB1